MAEGGNFQELNTSREDALKLFIKQTRKLWAKDLVVHGIEKNDRWLKFGDLDGKCALGLMQLAGIDIRQVEYVPQGEEGSTKGKIHLDTGNRYGFVVEDDGETAYFDHHGPQAVPGTCATKIVYEILSELGLLKMRDATKAERLKNLVEFVRQVDNKSYPGYWKYYPDSYRTMLGLQQFVSFQELWKFFKENGNPVAQLSADDLKKYSKDKKHLFEASQKKKKRIPKSLDAIGKLEQEGWILASPYYGKIIVDFNNSIPDGSDATKYKGYDMRVVWNEKQQSFAVLSAGREFNSDFKLRQGTNQRGRMWMKDKADKGPLKIKLQEILEQLMQNSSIPATGKLLEYLTDEK